MSVVHGIQNVKTIFQPWASFLEDFSVGGKILENLRKRGEKVDIKLKVILRITKTISEKGMVRRGWEVRV